MRGKISIVSGTDYFIYSIVHYNIYFERSFDANRFSIINLNAFYTALQMQSLISLVTERTVKAGNVACALQVTSTADWLQQYTIISF